MSKFDKATMAALKSTKHAAAMSYRHRVQPYITRVRDVYWGLMERVNPYHFDPGFYPHHFIRRPSLNCQVGTTVPRVIYTAWFGPAMPERRARSLDRIKAANPEFNVVFVTADTLGEFILHDAPLHPCWEYLGPIARSDYLRGYLMHHHGGGWSDLKRPTHNWGPVADLLDASSELWAAGYREVSSAYVEPATGALGAHLQRHYRATIGPSAYLCKPTSPFTSDWWEEMNHRLDYWADALRRFPCSEAYEIPRDHPIGWAELGGEIVHPLSLKHHDHLCHDDRIKPVLKDYR